MPPAKRISTDAAAPSGPGRFVLGFGGAIDHEIEWDDELIGRLARDHAIRLADCDPDQPIVDERSLIGVILGHALARRGGERFVKAPDIIAQFSARHRRTVTIGGTCVRAGLIMRTLGVRSTVLLVAIDETFRALFPADCDYLVSDDEAPLVPHLIVQLPAHGCIPVLDGEVTIENANRLIFVNDPPQLAMQPSPDLPAALTHADVFLISGFNAMWDADLLRRRVATVADAAESLGPGAMVMFEDAGYHSDAVSRAAHELIIPLADVFSMNEDEMQAHLARDVDLLDPALVAQALEDLHRIFPGPTLVIHTRHWALASGPRAAELESALAGGIQAATARFLHGDHVTPEDVAAIAQETVPEDHRAVAQSVEATNPAQVRCVPAYVVHTTNPTTIGLGDCFVGGFLAALAPIFTTERMPQ